MNTRVLEHDDIEVIEDGTFTYQESDESSAFREFKSSFDDEKMGTLRVHRVPASKTITNKAAQKTIYLFSCTIDQFDFDSLLEYLRDHYGGGTYRLIGSRSGHAGVAFNRLVEIEEPRKTQFMGGLGKNDPLINTGDPTANIIDRMGAVLLESQQRQEEMFSTLVGPQTGGDAFKQMTDMMTAMGSMMTAMGLKAPEPLQQKSFMDQMQEFVAMQTMIKELGDGGSGAEANLYSLLGDTIRAFGGPLAAAIAAGQADGAINDQGLLAAPKPVEKTPEQIKEEQEIAALKAQVKFLIANAEAEIDPEEMAKLIVEKTPEEELDKLYDFLNSENFLEQIISLDVNAEPHKNWFIKLRDTILDLLSEPEISEDDLCPHGLILADCEECKKSPEDLLANKDKPIVPESETVAESDQTGSDIGEKPDGDAPTDS